MEDAIEQLIVDLLNEYDENEHVLTIETFYKYKEKIMEMLSQ